MKKLNVLLDVDKKKWDVFIRELEFKCTNNFMGSVSDSNIQMHEFNCGSKLINIHSSPYISQLKYTGNTKDTFFIVNSISSLSYSGSGSHAISQNGSSVFLPSDNQFNIESKTRRRSLSLFLNRKNIASLDDYYILEQFLWKKSDRLESGNIIDNTIQQLYYPHSDLFLERTFSLVSNLVSYEIEKIKNNNKKTEQINFINDLYQIINDGFKSQDLNLSFIAKKMGVSERTIQNKSLLYGIKLHTHIQQKRIRYFKLLIDTQPSFNNEYLAIKSGFNSIATANRVFISEFGFSISFYRKNSRNV